jgi:hypothetical protein
MGELDNRAGLDGAELEALEMTLRPLTTLQAVVRWAFSLLPPSDVTEVIVQDEFSHDVVLSWTAGRFLAFDTT